MGAISGSPGSKESVECVKRPDWPGMAGGGVESGRGGGGDETLRSSLFGDSFRRPPIVMVVVVAVVAARLLLRVEMPEEDLGREGNGGRGGNFEGANAEYAGDFEL